MTDQGDGNFEYYSGVNVQSSSVIINVKTQLKGSSLLKIRSVASIYARVYSKNMQKEVYFYLLKAFFSQSQDD